MNMKHYLTLCIKEVTGNITDSEKQLLNSWLAESDSNKKEYEKIRKIWSNSSIVKTPELPDADTEWNKLYDRLKLDGIKYKDEDSIIDRLLKFFELIFKKNMKPALGGIVVILLLIAGFFIFNREEYTPHINTITTTNKEHRSIALSDGSIAELNNASSIEFVESFNDEVREVKLKGEAFFSITKDDRPFIVITENANTKVLGTKFNVWTRGQVTRVMVKEGLVNLTPKNENAKGVVLSKNQLSTLTKNQEPTPPENVNADYLLGWMDGKLVFIQTPLDEIIDELVRHFDKPITLEDNTLKTYTLTGSFRNNDVDSVLTMICLSLDLDFVKQHEGYLIKNKN